MKNRHLSFILIYVLIVSVFLCSCGIPTFCTLDYVKLKADTSTELQMSTSTDIIIYSTQAEPDLYKMNSSGPGLVIFFYQPSDITGTFAGDYYKITSGIITIPSKISQDSVSFTSNYSIGSSLYSFYLNGSDKPSTPSYITSLYNYIDELMINCQMTLTGNYSDSGSKQLESVTLSFYGDRIAPITLDFDHDLVFNSGKFDESRGMYIAAAFVSAPGAGNFDNFYWSYLNPVGVLKLHNR